MAAIRFEVNHNLQPGRKMIRVLLSTRLIGCLAVGPPAQGQLKEGQMEEDQSEESSSSKAVVEQLQKNLLEIMKESEAFQL